MNINACILLEVFTGVSGIAAICTIFIWGLRSSVIGGVFTSTKFIPYIWLATIVGNLTIWFLNKISQIHFPEEKHTWGIVVNTITRIIYTIVQFL